MEIEIIIIILFLHWFADFVLQTDKQAKGKSKNWNDLISHTFNYSLIFWCFAMITSKGDIFLAFNFWFITFIFHTIIDYFTSRLNSKLWANGKIHLFFVNIGFDQFLHIIQLILTYKLIINI